MRKTLLLSSILLGLALAAPGFAQTRTDSHQDTDRGSAAPDHTAGASGYTGHGRLGNKALGSGDSGKGGPSENAGSDGGSTGSNSPGQIHRP